MKIGDPWATTPRPKQAWRALSDADRIAAAAEVLTEHAWGGIASVVTAVQSGTITVQFGTTLPVAERGKVVRTIEAQLQAGIEPGVTVSLMPRVDKNRLRQLRGVKIL